MNVVHLIGRIGKDPELHKFDDGRQKVSFSLATSERYKDKNGDPQEQTEWHNIVFYGPVAEVIEKYFSKGDPIVVSGKLQYRSYEKNGEKKYYTQIAGSNFEFAPKSTPGGTDANAGSVPQASTATNATGSDQDDLPF